MGTLRVDISRFQRLALGAAVVLAVILLQLLGTRFGSAAATPVLSLNPDSGAAGDVFDGTWSWTDCGNYKAQQVDFYWDDIPPYGHALGSAPIVPGKCVADTKLVTPSGAKPGPHTVFAFFTENKVEVKESEANQKYTIVVPQPTPPPPPPGPGPTATPTSTPTAGPGPAPSPGSTPAPSPSATPPAPAEAAPRVTTVTVSPPDCTIDNWGFELGTLDCWAATGTAFAVTPGSCASQPVRGEVVSTNRIYIAGQRPASLGGDYWEGVYPIGVNGHYWVGTADGRSCGGSPAGDSATGSLSREFDVASPYIDFLIGGGNSNNHEKVELDVRQADGSWQLRHFATGRNSEILRREVWEVRELQGQHARILVTDDGTGSWGHINVDDFRFPASDPRPGFISVRDGGYTLYRDSDFPVWGFADMHSHPVANLGFGGHLVNGSVDGPPEVALSTDDDVTNHGLLGVGGGISGNLQLSLFEGGLGHLNGGYPNFDGWPNFKSLIHQQMYIDWIHRAYQGGLRLVVALAVNNELLAQEFGDFHPYDDRTSYSRQLAEMQRIVAAHPTWMEIAHSPREARRIIAENKLAVIQGIEVPSFNNCKVAGDCTEESVTRELRRVYDQYGVRHMIPIHVADNQFGGAAIYNDSFSVFNRYQTNDYFQVRSGRADGIQYRLAEQEHVQVSWFRSPIRFTTHSHIRGFPGPPAVGAYYAPPLDYDIYLRNGGSRGLCAPQDDCHGMENAQGLKPLGTYLINRMMDMHMMVDIDHEGELSARGVLAIADGRHYSGIAAGHMDFRELALTRRETADTSKLAHESMKSNSTVRHIASLGGVIAPIGHSGDIRTYRGSSIAANCAGSSKSWIQEYLKAVDMMGGRGVGIGVEGNGLAGGPAPRFGTFACGAVKGPNEDSRRQGLRNREIRAQTNGVRYDSPIRDYRAYRFADVGDDETGGYLMEQRDVWEALAIFKSGTNPDNFDGPNFWTRTFVQTEKIRNLAKGFYCREQDPPWVEILSTAYEERRAACIVAQGREPSDHDFGADEVGRLYAVIRPVWQRWQAMEGGANAPLHRQQMGRRDFDINLDGLAQYGLLPDFFQDVKNDGVTPAQLKPLFSSAEAYLDSWQGTYGAARP